MVRTPLATPTDLRAQNAKLRAELAELQETLRAIREDSVDAFVIETTHGPQVFMLQELAAESSLLRDEILDAITDSVIVYGDDERVIYINAAAKKCYGVSTSDALGSLIDGVFRVRWHSPEDARRKAAALRDSGKWHGECVHVTRAGKLMPVDVTVSRLGWAGHRAPVWLVATHAAAAAAATAAAGTQAKLETQALELRRWAAIGTLATQVADDFGSPMDAAKLEAATSRARELRQQLKALGADPTSTRPLTSVATIVSEAARLMRVGLPAKIVIESSCATTTPFIRADAIQLLRALLSLGSNAGHAMENRLGTLGIHATDVTVTEAMVAEQPGLRTGSFVCITVSDTGHGMDLETQQRAFEPFFSRKPPGKGAGLGLTVVQGIVQGHQGAIVVHSTPGVGSSFELYFPCIPGDAA